jgi:hypothetical protein
MPKVITDFTIELEGGGTATFAKAWLYGRIAYVPHRAGSGLYAQLYEVSSGALIASWDHQPINGKTAQVKECADGLDTLDWQPIVEQRDRLPHDIIHPFIERANALIRKAGGRSMLQCPACSEKYRQYFKRA